MMQLRIASTLALMVAALVGCDGVRSQPPDPSGGDEVRHFDAASAGTIDGRLTWAGPIPQVEPLEVTFNPDSSPVRRAYQWRDHPNAPAIDARTRGIAGAVVYLRGIDPRRARPWDLPPARVEIRDGRFHVLQGTADTHIGFVQRGAGVEMVSREDACHSLHASGAAFFTLSFPDPARPLTRRFPGRGIVELSSNAGFYWMQAYLFVADHPYYVRTDSEGRFTLAAVPPGTYDVVAWLPNWIEASHDRDPETGFCSRLRFGPAGVSTGKVTVAPGGRRRVDLELTPASFRGTEP